MAHQHAKPPPRQLEQRRAERRERARLRAVLAPQPQQLLFPLHVVVGVGVRGVVRVRIGGEGEG